MITKRTSFLLWSSLILTTESLASVSSDSMMSELFPKLTEQIGLKTPKLKANEYEIRIWNRQALRYGEAQMAYVLRKKTKKFTIVKYIINSDQYGFQYATSLKPTITITPLFWERLLKRTILTLPDQSVVFERLYPKVKSRIDTTQVKMEADGSFTIKAHKTPKRQTIVSDGEGYSFELFSANSYQVYNYGNPDVYLSDNPQSEESQNVLGILNDLSLVFRSDKLGRGQAKAINKD